MAKLIIVLFVVAATVYGRSLNPEVLPLTRAVRSPCSTCGLLSTQNWSGLSKDRNGQSTVFSGASAASNNPQSPVAGEALSLASSTGNGGLDGIADGLGVFKSSRDNGASSKSSSIGLSDGASGLSGGTSSDSYQNSYGNGNGRGSQEATNSFSSDQSSSSFGSNNRGYGHPGPVGNHFGGSSNNARYEIYHQQQTKGEQKGDFGSGLQEQNSASSNGNQNSYGSGNGAQFRQGSQGGSNIFSSAQSSTSSFGGNNRGYGNSVLADKDFAGSSNNGRVVSHQYKQQTEGLQRTNFDSESAVSSENSNGNKDSSQNSSGSGDDRQFDQGSQKQSNSLSSAQSSSSSLGSKNPDYVHPRPVSNDFTGSKNNGQYESFHYLHQNKDRNEAFGSGSEAQSSGSSNGNNFESSQRGENSYVSNGNGNAESGLSGSSYGGQTTQNGFGGFGQSGLQKNQAGFESSGSQSSSGNLGSYGSSEKQGSYGSSSNQGSYGSSSNKGSNGFSGNQDSYGSSGNQGSYGSSNYKESHYSQQSGSGYSRESAGNTSGSTGAYNSEAGSSSGNAQDVLGGALGLASQGLQAARQPGCTTCSGKSNFALSNAKSWNGNAVALSIGG